MPDLFDAPIVPGFRRGDDFLSPDEESGLIARIDAEALSPFRFQQWTGKRLTRSYGWSYDFETGIFAEADPIPDWLLTVRARAALFAGIDPGDLVQAMLTRYDPSAGIGWHKDRSVFDAVIGISLESETVLRLRRRTDAGFQRARAALERRSIYLLSGEVRNQWEHSIAPMEAPRRSITFRSRAAKA